VWYQPNSSKENRVVKIEAKGKADRDLMLQPFFGLEPEGGGGDESGKKTIKKEGKRGRRGQTWVEGEQLDGTKEGGGKGKGTGPQGNKSGRAEGMTGARAPRKNKAPNMVYKKPLVVLGFRRRGGGYLPVKPGLIIELAGTERKSPQQKKKNEEGGQREGKAAIER